MLSANLFSSKEGNQKELLHKMEGFLRDMESDRKNINKQLQQKQSELKLVR